MDLLPHTAYTKSGASILVPDIKIDRPGLFDIMEPLRGYAWTSAVVNAFTGLCVGWTYSHSLVMENAPARR